MSGDTAILDITIYNAETSATSTTQTTSSSTTTTIVQTSGANIAKVWITTVYDGDKKISASSSFEDIGKIASGANIPLSFKITSDEGITEDWYFPKVKINLEDATHQDVEYPITIRVSNKTVELINSEVPSTIYMSGATDISLTVVNNFEASIDAVTVEPNNVEDFNIYPKRVFIGTMEPDSNEEVSFSLNPLIQGNLNLSFIVNYKNGQNLHNSTLDFTMKVVDSLDVAPVIYSVPSTVGKGENARIRLEVYNAKSEEIAGVIVNPVNTNLSISPSQYFIGSMDPDDVFSASFEVDTNNLNIGENYSIDFEVSFKQGENYFETPAVNAKFKVVQTTETNNPLNMCYAGVTIIVVLISIILFFFIRKRRKEK
jgi:hypothetical protein